MPFNFMPIGRSIGACSRRLPSTPSSSRTFTSTRPSFRPRVPLGRIEVKRIPIDSPEAFAAQGFGGGMPKRSIWKPIIFATTLAGSAYVAAALYTNADTNEWSEKLGHGSWWRRGSDLPTDEEIKRAKAISTAKKLQNSLNGLVKNIRDWPESLKVPITRVYISLSETYLHTPPAQLACLGIIGFNGLVFLAWRIPRFEPFMRRYFMHWPVGANHRVITLATSVFSHQSLPHYAFNSIALYSFGSAAYQFLSRPNARDIDAINNKSDSWFGFDFGPYLGTSTTTPHFLAFFLAAGLVSSLTSHLNTVLVRLPRLLRDLSNTARVSTASALAAHSAVLPSLGASGAIYATLTLTSLAFPEASVSLIFLPFVPIQIGYGVAGMVAVDVLGLIRGWRVFDHVAHLSGAAFGFLYYSVGKDFWTWLRVKLGAQERRVADV